MIYPSSKFLEPHSDTLTRRHMFFWKIDSGKTIWLFEQRRVHVHVSEWEFLQSDPATGSVSDL